MPRRVQSVAPRAPPPFAGARVAPGIIEIIGAVLFAVAILHTFSTKLFERLAHARPAHAGLWHLLGEVEVVFGFWALVLMLCMAALLGKNGATAYLDGRDFTEPLFVFVIMVIAATRPILQSTAAAVGLLARALPLPGSMGPYIVILAVVPLLGSFITEPAAMTLAALILARRIFAAGISPRLQYATLGVLFVNVSIGGTLTSYAAPPVLMVAATWGWDSAFMAAQFGWKATLAVLVNATAMCFVLKRHLQPAGAPAEGGGPARVPLLVSLIHLGFLAGVVLLAHHPVMFLGLFLLFLGFTQAYQRYQQPLILKEGLLVGFFLAGLVVLGGMQQWWLQPIVSSLEPTALFFGATALTAITDNAALTYLGSLIAGMSDQANMSDQAKYMLVAGAVAGGGLTVIANAPNPAGVALLREGFNDESIGVGGLPFEGRSGER
eukprot:gene15017-17216_t